MLGVGLAAALVWNLPFPLGVLGATASLAAFGSLIYVATRHDQHWVELAGDKIRAKHLHTRRTTERPINEVESLREFAHRNRTVEIRFRNCRNPVRILRADPAMTNADALIVAVVDRMSQLGETCGEVIEFEGRPLLKSFHWAGEQPNNKSSNNAVVTLASYLLTSILMGSLVGLWSSAEGNRQALASVPPHEMSINELIQKGPGVYRHITVTGFRRGGYASEGRDDPWRNVWVALYPVEGESREIKVILSSKTIADERSLDGLLSSGRVTGICSAAPRSSWGGVLGPQLVSANDGHALAAAWELEELRSPPGERMVTSLRLGAAGLFVAVLILAAFTIRSAKSN